MLLVIRCRLLGISKATLVLFVTTRFFCFCILYDGSCARNVPVCRGCFFIVSRGNLLSIVVCCCNEGISIVVGASPFHCWTEHFQLSIVVCFVAFPSSPFH